MQLRNTDRTETEKSQTDDVLLVHDEAKAALEFLIQNTSRSHIKLYRE